MNCWVVPTAMLGFTGITEIDTRAAEVSIAVPETFPEVAVMVTEPTALEVASPPGLMVATALSDELHEDEAVKSCTDPSENVPVALNCLVVPGVMFVLAGTIVMETSVGEDVPPAQPATKTDNSITRRNQ